MDSAVSVTARCWITRAKTAGPKKLRTRGADGETFSVSAVVGRAITSGGTFVTASPSSPSAKLIPSSAACSTISALRLLTRIVVASPASWS
jgi:hypothetical protein